MARIRNRKTGEIKEVSDKELTKYGLGGNVDMAKNGKKIKMKKYPNGGTANVVNPYKKYPNIPITPGVNPANYSNENDLAEASYQMQKDQSKYLPNPYFGKDSIPQNIANNYKTAQGLDQQFGERNNNNSPKGNFELFNIFSSPNSNIDSSLTDLQKRYPYQGDYKFGGKLKKAEIGWDGNVADPLSNAYDIAGQRSALKKFNPKSPIEGEPTFGMSDQGSSFSKYWNPKSPALNANSFGVEQDPEGVDGSTYQPQYGVPDFNPSLTYGLQQYNQQNGKDYGNPSLSQNEQGQYNKFVNKQNNQNQVNYRQSIPPISFSGNKYFDRASKYREKAFDSFSKIEQGNNSQQNQPTSDGQGHFVSSKYGGLIKAENGFNNAMNTVNGISSAMLADLNTGKGFADMFGTFNQNSQVAKWEAKQNAQAFRHDAENVAPYENYGYNFQGRNNVLEDGGMLKAGDGTTLANSTITSKNDPNADVIIERNEFLLAKGRTSKFNKKGLGSHDSGQDAAIDVSKMGNGGNTETPATVISDNIKIKNPLTNKKETVAKALEYTTKAITGKTPDQWNNKAKSFNKKIDDAGYSDGIMDTTKQLMNQGYDQKFKLIDEISHNIFHPLQEMQKQKEGKENDLNSILQNFFTKGTNVPVNDRKSDIPGAEDAQNSVLQDEPEMVDYPEEENQEQDMSSYKKFGGFALPKAGDGWSDEWTKKILAHERKAGHPGGTGFGDNNGYDDADWTGDNAAKFQKYINDAKAEVPNFDKLPDAVKASLVDYKFNNGNRSIKDLLLRAEGKITGDQLNSKEKFSSTPNFKLLENPSFVKKIAIAKEDAYLSQAEKNKEGFQGNFDNNFFVRSHMWDNLDNTKTNTQSTTQNPQTSQNTFMGENPRVMADYPAQKYPQTTENKFQYGKPNQYNWMNWQRNIDNNAANRFGQDEQGNNQGFRVPIADNTGDKYGKGWDNQQLTNVSYQEQSYDDALDTPQGRQALARMWEQTGKTAKGKDLKISTEGLSKLNDKDLEKVLGELRPAYLDSNLDYRKVDPITPFNIGKQKELKPSDKPNSVQTEGFKNTGAGNFNMRPITTNISIPDAYPRDPIWTKNLNPEYVHPRYYDQNPELNDINRDVNAVHSLNTDRTGAGISNFLNAQMKGREAKDRVASKAWQYNQGQDQWAEGTNAQARMNTDIRNLQQFDNFHNSINQRESAITEQKKFDSNADIQNQWNKDNFNTLQDYTSRTFNPSQYSNAPVINPYSASGVDYSKMTDDELKRRKLIKDLETKKMGGKVKTKIKLKVKKSSK